MSTYQKLDVRIINIRLKGISSAGMLITSQNLSIEEISLNYVDYGFFTKIKITFDFNCSLLSSNTYSIYCSTNSSVLNNSVKINS